MVFFIFLLEFGAVPTVWYFCFSIRVWSCSYSVVFFVLFFSIRVWSCSYSVVFIVVFLLEFGAVPTVWYFLFFY